MDNLNIHSYKKRRPKKRKRIFCSSCSGEGHYSTFCKIIDPSEVLVKPFDLIQSINKYRDTTVNNNVFKTSSIIETITVNSDLSSNTVECIGDEISINKNGNHVTDCIVTTANMSKIDRATLGNSNEIITSEIGEKIITNDKVTSITKPIYIVFQSKLSDMSTEMEIKDNVGTQYEFNRDTLTIEFGKFYTNIMLSLTEINYGQIPITQTGTMKAFTGVYSKGLSQCRILISEDRSKIIIRGQEMLLKINFIAEKGKRSFFYNFHTLWQEEVLMGAEITKPMALLTIGAMNLARMPIRLINEKNEVVYKRLSKKRMVINNELEFKKEPEIIVLSDSETLKENIGENNGKKSSKGNKKRESVLKKTYRKLFGDDDKDEEIDAKITRVFNSLLKTAEEASSLISSV